jgi:hypothetical protein
MNAKRRKEIKTLLTNIANGSENRMPLWTVMDRFTCALMRDAVKAIERLEKKKAK